MARQYIQDDHIQNLISSKRASVVEKTVSADFSAYLESLDWIGNGIDWSKYPNIELRFDEEGFGSTISQTYINNCDYWVFFFCQDQEGLMLSRNFAQKEIDTVFWQAPGKRFIFGANKIGDGVEYLFESFAQYDGGDFLHFTLSKM